MSDDPRDGLHLVHDQDGAPPRTDEDAAAAISAETHADSRYIDIGPTAPRPILAQRQEIRISTDIKPVVDDAEEAILKMPRRNLYQRSGMLVRVVRDNSPTIKGHKRPPGSIIIKQAGASYMRELFSRAASWWALMAKDVPKWNKMSGHDQENNWRDVWTKKLPPTWTVECLMDRGQWRFPPLTGIIAAPTMRPDGSILSRPGYDAATGLLYLPGDTLFPPVPDMPTQNDARNALDRLVEPFWDFPFANRSDRSAALSAVLALVCRAAILGPVPLFAVRAHLAGTGKTLIADIVSLIGTGRIAPKWSQSQTEDEERKRLMAIAIEGDPVLLIDNVTKALGSGSLDMALTSGTIKDRVLGVTGTAEAPFRPVVFATGNNLQVKGDTARRVIPVDIDANCERPELRSDWKYPDVKKWVLENRASLVVDALTACRAYAAAGWPRVDMPEMGSFEDFSKVARAVIVWAGLPDPVEGRERVRRESDPELELLRTVMTTWHDYFDDRAVTLKEVAEELEEAYGDPAKTVKAALEDATAGYSRGTFSTKLGYYMRKHKGKILDGLRLDSGEREGGGYPWAVLPLNTSGTTGGTE